MARGRRSEFERVEQLDDAGFQDQPCLGNDPVVTQPDLHEGIDWKAVAKMREQQRAGERPGSAGHPADDLAIDRVAALRGGEQNRLLVQRLAIDEQPVHVENDSLGHSGQAHSR